MIARWLSTNGILQNPMVSCKFVPILRLFPTLWTKNRALVSLKSISKFVVWGKLYLYEGELNSIIDDPQGRQRGSKYVPTARWVVLSPTLNTALLSKGLACNETLPKILGSFQLDTDTKKLIGPCQNFWNLSRCTFTFSIFHVLLSSFSPLYACFNIPDKSSKAFCDNSRCNRTVLVDCKRLLSLSMRRCIWLCFIAVEFQYWASGYIAFSKHHLWHTYTIPIGVVK